MKHPWRSLILALPISLLAALILSAPRAFAAPPDMPTGVQASDGTYDTHIRITWNTVSGATYYYVHRRTDPTPNFNSGVVWADTAPPFDNRYDGTMPPTPYVTYYYWVRACNSDDCSSYSGPDSGWRPDIGPTATSTPTVTRTASRTPTCTRTRTRTPTRLATKRVIVPVIMKQWVAPGPTCTPTRTATRTPSAGARGFSGDFNDGRMSAARAALLETRRSRPAFLRILPP